MILRIRVHLMHRSFVAWLNSSGYMYDPSKIKAVVTVAALYPKS